MRNLRVATALLALIVGTLMMSAPAKAGLPEIPTPAVTGPIPATADSYPFLATDFDLDKYGYVEEEFFIEGLGYIYDTSGPYTQDATRTETGGPNTDGTYPFKTRIVVRRPANPADANGNVVAEWNNVTATQDIEWNWFGDPEFMLRNGYTFVGVTAQNTGVNSLLSFNAARYAGLTVNGGGTVPTGPGLDSDALSYDVFGAALNAIKGNGTGDDPLGGINADVVIASGESQSCGRLASHHNEIQPLQGIADAYLLTVCSSLLRDDRPEKTIRVITETENRTPRPVDTHPDTTSIRHWEVAGASHLPRLAWDNVAGVLNRDFFPITVDCQKFPLSLVQWPFTANRAVDGLVDWVKNDVVPPTAPRGQYDGEDNLVRDENGIAQGGIRYPEMTVPTGVNDGINSAAPGGSLFSAFCGLLGSNTLFERSQLDALYEDFADYVNQYADATDDFLATGFILAEDAERLKAISRQFAELRPTAPMATAKKSSGKVGLSWVGTEAPDTSFLVQRKPSANKGGWKDARDNVTSSSLSLKNEPEGTHRYRVRSSTVIPANNIAEARTTTTSFSEELANIKVDKSGPKKPKIKIKGKRIGKKTYRGKVKVKFIGKPDRKLPDGSPGVGLKRKSVPKTRRIKKKGRTVIKAKTRDRLGNRSKTARVVIRIKR
ncbi:MAG: alpha/beta hydrolase domain-containing protein [Acidobacteriota bacterium]